MAEILMKYWDTADGITAFACVQNVAFLLALLNSDVRVTLGAAPWATRGSVVLFWIFYSLGVIACVGIALNEIGVSDPREREAWNYALAGRLVAIAVFALVAFAALLTPDRTRSGRAGS